MVQWPTELWHYTPLQHHPLATSTVPSSFTSISASVKGTKGGTSCASIGLGPHFTRWPTSSIQMARGGTPYSITSLDLRSSPSQKCCCIFFACHMLWHWQLQLAKATQKILCPLFQKWSQDFCLVSQAWWQWMPISWKKTLVGRG